VDELTTAFTLVRFLRRIYTVVRQLPLTSLFFSLSCFGFILSGERKGWRAKRRARSMLSVGQLVGQCARLWKVESSFRASVTGSVRRGVSQLNCAFDCLFDE
jgi:hypothetical protein